ncbi:MAG: glycosyltransferase family 4 protein, partial [Vampirovibrionia bacterium]
IRIPFPQAVFCEQTDLVYYLKKHHHPLIVNLTNTAPAFYKNQIVTIHDLMFLKNPKWYSKKHYYFYKNLFRQIARNSKKVVTVSNFSKKEIIKYFNVPENRIEVVYNAVSQEFIELARQNFENNTNQYKPNSNDGVGCRGEAPAQNHFPLPGEGVGGGVNTSLNANWYNYGRYILAVSSLDPRKNFINLIQAFDKLKLKDVKLLIVGDKGVMQSQKHFAALIKDNPDIIFTGHITDKELAGLYKNAILFVFPSLYEGFGIPPLEAMACGCPTVVSKIASIPEVCADASYYIDPNDINSIAKGIQEVLNSESMQNDLREKGLKRVKHFSWRDSAQKYVDIIQNLN